MCTSNTELQLDVQGSKIFVTNYMYGYLRPGKAVILMSGTKYKGRKLNKEDARRDGENGFGANSRELALK
jgi:hypothetical protein